jgi:hypothetical protein
MSCSLLNFYATVDNSNVIFNRLLDHNIQCFGTDHGMRRRLMLRSNEASPNTESYGKYWSCTVPLADMQMFNDQYPA